MGVKALSDPDVYSRNNAKFTVYNVCGENEVSPVPQLEVDASEWGSISDPLPEPVQQSIVVALRFLADQLEA
jgi:hypothetical protein